jgi:sarcosine oxidase subunit alpha
MDNVRVLTRTTAFGYYAQNHVGLLERVTEHLANRRMRIAAARTSVAGARQAA